ncbi:(deoxy)nucleoside triphosphate pyrophosphohydrolase [Marihabitans asiaticum]|uniref:8-oxo-dGTP diphosphatase n=1 Tax=Marihabitans asiaticum TaxID=415218 RepID=A0A560WGC2_9MICO|nr:(deoxy)nucleoside triphosphate pyrophosphohydrolase [Marihabitans asiaticum]TWD16733.1 8-oxo-dGTP diphosphatase [Marihabitans asiaticum]
MSKEIRVVGAVIVEGGKVLCVQRSSRGVFPGKWEFPGGKIECGEAPRDALAREIREELDCVVRIDDEVTTTRHEYSFGVVTLTTFWCRLASGTPRLVEHVAQVWLSPRQIVGLDWAPADI